MPDCLLIGGCVIERGCGEVIVSYNGAVVFEVQIECRFGGHDEELKLLRGPNPC